MPHEKVLLCTVSVYKMQCYYLRVEISDLALWMTEKGLTATPETYICDAYSHI
jgi:hypothetical protein